MNRDRIESKDKPLRDLAARCGLVLGCLVALSGSVAAHQSTAYYEGHEITVTQQENPDNWTMTVLRYENRESGVVDTTETYGMLGMVQALTALQPDFQDTDCLPSAFLFICADFDVVGILLAWMVEAGS